MGRIKKVSACFYIVKLVELIIILSDFFRVYVIIGDGFNKKFLLKFYHSRYLKCGTCVFGEPNNSCLCSCSWIAMSSVVFTR